MNKPTNNPPAIPWKERYLEDYWVGEVALFGDYLITKDEVISFAQQYDPQVFHLDEQAAKNSSFGQLVASGWMTAGIMMRLMVLHFISPNASMGSPGVDQIRWTKPVKPGDRLSLKMTVTSARRSISKPDRGIIEFDNALINQDGDVVMTMKGMGMNRCRNPDANP
jgi:acyl dehydratase